MAWLDSLLLALAVGAALTVTSEAAHAEIVWDFESGDLQGWQVVEGQFAQLISERPFFHNRPEQPYNKQGRHFLSTLEMPNGTPNDTQTGVAVSPVFRLTGPQITLLVGGGAHADTQVVLCTEDGEEVLSAAGRNDETMQPVTWDATAVVGRNVFVKVVDRNTGPWGHVTLDDFRAQGEIDSAATERLAAQFAALEQARLERRAAERERRLAELTDEAVLLARGEQTVYSGERLTAIRLPVGGIGTGNLEMDGRGARGVWRIFGNFAGAQVPNSFFAVRAQAEGDAPVVRVLETEPRGAFTPVAGLTFRGEYPFGWYGFEDPELPVRVSLEVLNPVIPLDSRRSGIPCAIFRLTAENTGAAPVEVGFLATQQNVVGFTGQGAIDGRRYPNFVGNRNRVLREGGTTVVHMTADLPADAPGAGDMALAMLGDGVTCKAAWADLGGLAAEFGDTGHLAGPEEALAEDAGTTIDGALATAFTLQPGERRTVPVILTWYFPNVRHGEAGWGGYGFQYTNWWEGALEVAREVVREVDELTRLTRLYHDTLYATNLPVYALDRISSQVAVLKTQTVFWSRSGYFGGWEGCNEGGGCCAGNCSHVWHYAQAHARLFPDLGRRMREQEFSHQLKSGLIPFRQRLMESPAGDAQAGAVLNSYREHLCSPDGQWLRRHWPAIRRAMDFSIATWDPDEDGMQTGNQHNTLDADSTGTSSWLGSMYLAALAAAEKMALLQDDQGAALRYRRIRELGMQKQNEALWNGEYYFQKTDAQLNRDYGTGCHIDQVLGHWWAEQLDLGRIYPEDRVRTALQSLFRYSFRPTFHGIPQAPRKFVADEDAGLQMITWPLGGRPDPGHCMLYADEVMSGFEYSTAGAMMQAGLLREALATLHAAWLRYDGRLRTNLPGGAWGTSGNPFGDDECGKYYARTMSVWSVLLAAQGFIYDGPAGLIGFRPGWKPEDHASMFLAAEGWGLFTQKREGGTQTERLEVRSGKLRLRTLVFEGTDDMKSVNVTVKVGAQGVPAKADIQGREVTVTPDKDLTVSSGETLEVRLG